MLELVSVRGSRVPLRARYGATALALPWCARDDEPEPSEDGETAAAPSAAPRAERPRSRTREQTVLVVDDEIAVRLVCSVNLAASGFRVLEAADGNAALAVARAERPDLILLDVMMPALDGFDVAAALAADPATESLPIVFLSARTGEADVARAREVGAIGYVTKPFEPLQLTQRIARLLDRIARGELAEVRDEFASGAGRA